MASHVAKIVSRSSRAGFSKFRSIHTSRPAWNVNDRKSDAQEKYGKIQTEKPLNPRLTNTTSTLTDDLPKVGKENAPPELLSSVDPSFNPKDPSSRELGVGELEGASFRVEPLRRVGEDIATMRARLTCLNPSAPSLFS